MNDEKLAMNDELNYKNNPLHGLSLKNLLTEIVEHYGFDILFAYLNINCFKTNPGIDSSVKFLKKMDWAREKVESFYLYDFKRLPLPSAEQLALSPRDRIVPDGQLPGEPAELSLEDAERLRKKRASKSAAYDADKKFAGSRAAGPAIKPATSAKHPRGPAREPDSSPKHPRGPAREQDSSPKHPRGSSTPATKSKVDPWAKSRK